MPRDRIAAVIEGLLEYYRSDLGDVRQELNESPTALRRESLLEAQEGLAFVIDTISSITGIASAYKATESLDNRIQGWQSSIMVQIVNHAQTTIRDEILTPLRVAIPPEQASEAAVRFLITKIERAQRSLFLADITKAGLHNWAMTNHMPLGMAVRNNLRDAGFDESALGATSLDDVWAELFYKALLAKD